MFLPVGFMTGIVGQFFKSFALTIAFAVSISLLVAFTLDPMLSSRFVRFIPLEERTRTRTGRFLERVGGFYDRIDRSITACSVGDRAPVEDRRHRGGGVREHVDAVGDRHRVRAAGRSRRVRGERRSARGHRRSSTTVAYAEVEKVVKEMPEVRQIFSTVGFEGSPLKASLRVKAGKKHERERTCRAQGRHARAPQADSAAEDDGGRSGVHAGRADAGAAQRVPARRRHGRTAAAQRRGRAEGQGGARAPDVDSTLETGQPEMVADVNASWRADLGFDVGSVAMQLRGMVEGIVPTRLRRGRHPRGWRRSSATTSSDRADAALPPTGAVVRARDIVRLQPEVGPAAIEREARRRQAKINIELSIDCSAR